ncbi:transposase [Candidatus Berkelbacteria bacterium]|nr:transposase [Candidatus Berkelbacteria bacterium]
MTHQTNSSVTILSKRTHAPEFKIQVVLESFQRDTTLEQICRRYELAPSVVH